MNLKTDPAVNANLNRIDHRKANVIRAVQQLPELADEGDMAMIDGTLHIRLQGEWHNVDDRIIKTLNVLTERVQTLENELEPLRESATALSGEVERLTERVQALENA